jgi:hypothetical protein
MRCVADGEEVQAARGLRAPQGIGGHLDGHRSCRFQRGARHVFGMALGRKLIGGEIGLAAQLHNARCNAVGVAQLLV